ncbi:unnamed protein product, partial [marine sediment metagenome]
QCALLELNNNSGNYTETPLEQNFTINDRMVNVTATYVGGGIYKVTSTATSPNGRSTTIECDVGLGVGSVTLAVATKKDMTLQNTIVNSSLDYPGEGNIHSAENILLTDCQIYGDATAMGFISGGEVIEPGIVTEYSLLLVPFPQDYSALYMAMAQEGGTHPLENMEIYEDRSLGPLYINGYLRIENATVNLTGTVYVTGDIIVEGSNLDGDENIVAGGDITIEQGSVRSDIIPIILCIKVDGRIYSEGHQEGPTTVDGVLYAPS